MTRIVESFSLSHAQVLDGATSFLAALGAAASEAEDVYGVNESSLDPDTGDFDNEGDDAVLSTWSWFNFADVTVQAGYFSFPLIENLTGSPIETITGTDEVQTMTASAATAGDFTLTFQGQTTDPIAFDATAAAVQTALEGLSNVTPGQVTVTGGPASTVDLTFTFDAELGDVAPLTANLDGLTGATGGVISTGTPGVSEAVAIDLWHEDSMNVAPKPMVVKMPAKDHLGAVRSLAIGLYRVNFKPITFEGPAYKDGMKVNYNGRAVFSPVDELGATFSDGKKRVGRVLSFV